MKKEIEKRIEKSENFSITPIGKNYSLSCG